MDFQTSGLTESELRARAVQLHEVLRALDDGELGGSIRERAFIAGALRAVELMQADLDQTGSIEPVSRDGRGR